MPSQNKNKARKFTDTFKKGDVVSIIRTRHGWHDGMICGKIIEIGDYTCTVKVTEGEKYEIGLEYQILKPRDIRKIS